MTFHAQLISDQHSVFFSVFANFSFLCLFYAEKKWNGVEINALESKTTKWSEEIKLKLTTRRYGKSAPPVLNDRQLIQEWFYHLFPIINILVNVRFAFTRSLALSVCVCVFCTLPSRSQDVVRADLTCTILLRTQLRTHSTTARETHDTRGFRMTMVKIVRVQGQGQREWARKKSANRLSEKRKWICFGRSVGARALALTCHMRAQMRSFFFFCYGLSWARACKRLVDGFSVERW